MNKSQPKTLSSLISNAAKKLSDAGIHNAKKEAVWLMQHVLQMKNSMFLINDSILTAHEINNFENLVERRLQHYPLQYLIGYVDFFNAVIQVNPDVLIPRPETEEMVELALTMCENKNLPLQCADLGTGSGCISIALAKEMSQSEWFACDVSEKALKVAKSNAVINSVQNKIKFFHGRWFDPFPPDACFDLIISNPPYVPNGEILQPELQYEPSSALFAGNDGLSDYKIILAHLQERLKKNGLFIGEFGDGQADFLQQIAENYKFDNVELFPDLSGKLRFIVIH